MRSQALTAEDQTGGAVCPFHGRNPSGGGFGAVAGTPHVHAGNEAQRGHMLHRLVGGAVLSHADGIVGEHPYHPFTHQRSQADDVAGVIRKHQERAAVGDEAAVQGQAVHGRAMPNSRTP